MWRHFRNSMFAVMNTPPDPDGAGGGGGGAVPPAPAPAPPPAGGTPPPPSGTPPADGTPGGTPPAKQYTFAEDRGNWVPPHRMSEISERARRAEENGLRYAAMLKAGTGVDIPMHLRTPEDQQNLAAREELFKIFPELKLIEKFKAMLPQLEDALPRIPDVLASGEQYWVAQGHRTIATLHEEAAKLYGMAEKDLTPFQRSTINNSFMSWIDANPAMGERFGRGDQGVLNEYITEWRNGFFEPARRVAQGGGGGGTPPAPRGRGDLPPAPRSSGIPPSGGTPPVPKTEDEVHNAAWTGFQAALNGRRP